MNIPSQHFYSRGFSLLETLIAANIISIATWVAIPAISVHARHGRLSAEALSLRLFLERAYAYALAHQEHVRVRLHPSDAVTISQTGEILESFHPSGAVTLYLAGKNELILECYPSISMSPATITLQHLGDSCDVISSLRGRIRATC